MDRQSDCSTRLSAQASMQRHLDWYTRMKRNRTRLLSIKVTMMMRTSRSKVLEVHSFFSCWQRVSCAHSPFQQCVKSAADSNTALPWRPLDVSSPGATEQAVVWDMGTIRATLSLSLSLLEVWTRSKLYTSHAVAITTLALQMTESFSLGAAPMSASLVCRKATYSQTRWAKFAPSLRLFLSTSLKFKLCARSPSERLTRSLWQSKAPCMPLAGTSLDSLASVAKLIITLSRCTKLHLRVDVYGKSARAPYRRLH